ncbi:MAG: glutathione S-transferase [Parvularculaceae bacterium]
MTTTLFVGPRNYSSWSLRPWLALKWAGIAFETRVLDLDAPGYGERRIADVVKASPGGTVPALHTGALKLWDSLAICEWAAEQAAPGALWPKDADQRALARAVSCEMHSGFAGVRRDLSMNIRRRCEAKGLPEDTLRDIARIEEIWTERRWAARAEGAHLFGARSIVDAFFTPVATRFRTYGVKLHAAAQEYCETLLADAAFREWERLADAEWKPFLRADTDRLYA